MKTNQAVVRIHVIMHRKKRRKICSYEQSSGYCKFNGYVSGLGQFSTNGLYMLIYFIMLMLGYFPCPNGYKDQNSNIRYRSETLTNIDDNRRLYMSQNLLSAGVNIQNMNTKNNRNYINLMMKMKHMPSMLYLVPLLCNCYIFVNFISRSYHRYFFLIRGSRLSAQHTILLLTLQIWTSPLNGKNSCMMEILHYKKLKIYMKFKRKKRKKHYTRKTYLFQNHPT